MTDKYEVIMMGTPGEYGRALKAARDERGMTLQHLAEACAARGAGAEISRSYLSRVENGEADPPTRPEVNAALTEVLGKSDEYFELLAESEHLRKHYPALRQAMYTTAGLLVHVAEHVREATVTGIGEGKPHSVSHVCEQLRYVKPADDDSGMILNSAVRELQTIAGWTTAYSDGIEKLQDRMNGLRDYLRSGSDDDLFEAPESAGPFVYGDDLREKLAANPDVTADRIMTLIRRFTRAPESMVTDVAAPMIELLKRAGSWVADFPDLGEHPKGGKRDGEG